MDVGATCQNPYETLLRILQTALSNKVTTGTILWEYFVVLFVVLNPLARIVAHLWEVGPIPLKAQVHPGPSARGVNFLTLRSALVTLISSENVLWLVAFVCCSSNATAVFADEGRRTISTPLGDLEFISISPGMVHTGRDIGLLEYGLRTGEPKRLNEHPTMPILVKEKFWLARQKLTVSQFAKFLNLHKQESTAYVTPGFLSQFVVKDGNYLPIFGKEEESVGCVSFEGAKQVADFLSLKTGIQFRLPHESEWLLASVGTDRRNAIEFRISKNKKSGGFPISEWSNGFEGFISPVGEWTLDTDSNQRTLLKRCVNSLVEREFLMVDQLDKSEIYGVRLLIIHTKEVENNQPAPPKNE